MSVFLLPHTAISTRQTRPVFTKPGPHIKSIAAHILSTGLLNPIIVRPVHKGSHKKTSSKGFSFVIPEALTTALGVNAKARYEVIDGFKRLCAIFHLKKTGQLPRTLTQIPCTIEDSAPRTPAKPIMLSEAELSQEITRRIALGASKEALVAQFECTSKVFEQIISLSFLHPKIKACFNDGHLNLAQASAFASFPNPDAQWRLMEQIGPFVGSKDILAQLTGPEAYVELPDGDVLILPTRRASMPDQMAFNRAPTALRIAA